MADEEQLVAALRACQRSIGRLRTALITVEGNLTKPYVDDPRWTSWSRFIDKPWREGASASEMARAALKAYDEDSVLPPEVRAKWGIPDPQADDESETLPELS